MHGRQHRKNQHVRQNEINSKSWWRCSIQIDLVDVPRLSHLSKTLLSWVTFPKQQRHIFTHNCFKHRLFWTRKTSSSMLIHLLNRCLLLVTDSCFLWLMQLICRKLPSASAVCCNARHIQLSTGSESFLWAPVNNLQKQSFLIIHHILFQSDVRFQISQDQFRPASFLINILLYAFLYRWFM